MKKLYIKPISELSFNVTELFIMTASEGGQTVIDDGGNVSDLPGDEIDGDTKQRDKWDFHSLW